MANPERRYVVKIDIQADGIQDICGVLKQLEYEFYSAHMAGDTPSTSIVSGGYGSGYTVEYRENEGVTHDSYIEMLNAYLEKRRSEISV